MKISTNIDRLRGYRIKIYPTEDQKDAIKLVINSYRAIYNIGLDIQNKNYADGNSYIKYFDMCKLFSDLRNGNPEYQWFNKIQLSTIRQAIRDLDNAFQGFFNHKTNYPKFKSKKRSKKFFTTRSDRTHIDGKYIRIPEIGLIYASNHPIPENFRLFNTGISFDGYDYWFYCQIERPVYELECNKSDIIGIDVGIRNMITTSDGSYYKIPDTKKQRKRMKRLHKRLSKHHKKYLTQSMLTKTKYEDIDKSKNMMKLQYKLFNTYKKISNKIKNSINIATKTIVESNPKAIVIENIKVGDQLRNSSWMRKFAPSILYYEIHRQLKYKAADRSIPVIMAPQDYASSQICSNCGKSHKVYGNKKFICPYCGFREDRDLNAAINLSTYGSISLNSM